MRAQKQERRRSVRVPLSPETSYVMLTDPEGKPCSGKVRDISIEGIGLTLACQYDPGSLMSVGLANRTGLYAKTLVLRTMRVVKQPDGSYLLGGSFVTRLNAEEMEALLG